MANSATYKSKDHEMAFWEKLYIPAIVKGLINTLRHLFMKKFTTPYPEKRLTFSDRFRGEHRLKKDEKGRIKCVACYMCSTACPSNCIIIEAAECPSDYGDDREKYPSSFIIDELRCIYCGFCEEACPKDAIELTRKLPRVYGSRAEFMYDREKLLNN